MIFTVITTQQLCCLPSQCQGFQRVERISSGSLPPSYCLNVSSWVTSSFSVQKCDALCGLEGIQEEGRGLAAAGWLEGVCVCVEGGGWLVTWWVGGSF